MLLRGIETILFHPDWGIYDMAVGSQIISAFSGPADNTSFDLITHKPNKNINTMRLNAKEQHLNTLYERVKKLRISKSIDQLESIFNEMIDDFPDEWLLSLEIFELATENSLEWSKKIQQHLESIKKSNPKKKTLIDDGLILISETIT